MAKMSEDLKKFKGEVRAAVANYIYSEGCSCCQGADHGEHEKKIAKLLSVPKYEDGSGYNFGKYKTEEKE